MKTLYIDDYTVFHASNDVGKKFKLELSNLIKESYPEPYDESNIKDILIFSLGHYAGKFEKICKEETSYEFYKTLFWLNEQAAELRHDDEASSKLNEAVEEGYLAIYRRVLKYILEEACTIKLEVEEINPSFKERVEAKFDDLFFLGDEILSMADLLAEQDMVGDVLSMQFDKEGIYVIRRKREFELAFQHIVDMNAYSPSSFVINSKAQDDFALAVKEAFNVDYPLTMSALGEIHQHHKLKKWDIIEMGFSEFSIFMNKNYDVPEEYTDSFLAGLYFTKDIKIPIAQLVRKPFSIDRFLNRPILVWNINGKDFCLVGEYSTHEALNHLFHNAFPWNKAPKEWETNQIFKDFLAKKEREHDTIFMAAVEVAIKPTGLIYQPNIEKLITKGGIVRIKDDKCGEIDFIVINEILKKIFIVECKHLVGRYDMANFIMDFNSFTKGKKSFNSKLEKKIKWVASNLNLVEQHFKAEKKLTSSIEDFTVEGIFIVNTPTFYMYNSKFRIYTYHEVAKVLTGKWVDKMYTLVTDSEDRVETLFIKYPYFTKKYMIEIPPDPYEDYPVDKFGFPIIPEDEKPIQ